MNVKDGEYYFAPHRRSWGVWKAGKTNANGTRMDEFITDFSTKIQARNFAYKCNGWNSDPQS